MKTIPELSSINEVHISSLIVLCRPEKLHDAQKHIRAMPATEIHASDESGKIIVVLESPTETMIVESIEKIEQVDGVISATMVYHQID